MLFISNSVKETLNFARNFYKLIQKKSVILLIGKIGTGKTTFVRGFLSNWNLEHLVTSPTFTIMNEYKNNEIKIHHFDLYRLNSEKEIIDIGLEDFINQADFTFIEWPEIAYNYLTFPTIKIKIEMGEKEFIRKFEIT